MSLCLGLGGAAVADAAAPGVGATTIQAPAHRTATEASRPKAKKGKIRVTVRGPKGLPARISVGRGASRRVVTKPAGRASVRRTLPFRVGRHVLKAETLVVRGTVLKPSIGKRKIAVRAGSVSPVSVRYRPVKGLARAPQLTALTSSTIGLLWNAGKADRSVVRLTSGSEPARSVKAGRPVKVAKGRALATKLTPGTTYTLSVFTRVKGSWRGPVPFTAGTVPAAGGPGAEFVAAAGTYIGDRQDVVAARSTGHGVAVRFRGDAPLIGSAVVLPPSPSLPHGYVGKVVGQSVLGDTELEQASLSDAFDYLSMRVPDLSSVPATRALATGRRTSGTARRGAGSFIEASCKERPKKADDPQSVGISESSDNLEGYDFVRTITLSERGLTAEVGASVDVDLAGSFEGEVLAHSQSFYYWWKKKKTVSVPYGAALEGSFGITGKVDAGIALSASQSADKSKDGSYDCAISLPEQAKTFMAGPVPLTVTFEVKAEIGISGTVKVEHVGATVGTMVNVSGEFGPGVDDRFDGSVVPSASLQTPTFSAAAAVEASASATLSFGPGGAADDHFGAMAGIEGKLTPLKLGLKGEYDSANKLCGQVTVGGSAGLDLLAKVWYTGPGPDIDWESSRISLLPESWREWAYFGTDQKPLDLPDGCADEKDEPGPTEDPDPDPDAVADLDEDGYTADVDCDDHDDRIHPGARDVPEDGIDQDCDGHDAVLGSGDVQVTLRWANGADLDLHVLDPDGDEIFYGHDESDSGGTLDVDANPGCSEQVADPVENIFWAAHTAPAGVYTVWPDLYDDCDEDPPSWRLTVRVAGAVVVDRTGTGELDEPITFQVG